MKWSLPNYILDDFNNTTELPIEHTTDVYLPLNNNRQLDVCSLQNINGRDAMPYIQSALYRLLQISEPADLPEPDSLVGTYLTI